MSDNEDSNFLMFELSKEIKYTREQKRQCGIKKVIFSIPIINKLRKLQKEHAFSYTIKSRPYTALLGENTKKIVTKISPINLYHAGGCEYMTSISTGKMATAINNLIKRGISVCGILRINNYTGSISIDDDLVGFGIRERLVKTPGLYLITIGRKEMIIEIAIRDSYSNIGIVAIPLEWDISKGDCQNDNKESGKRSVKEKS